MFPPQCYFNFVYIFRNILQMNIYLSYAVEYKKKQVMRENIKMKL